MPLPIITKETADSFAKISKENGDYFLHVITKLKTTNPVLYQYIDYTLALINKKYNVYIGAETASVVGTVIGLLESQSEADDMTRQFIIEEDLFDEKA